MKLVKMSLAAAMLLSASAFAIDNVKVSGDAKLFYGTDNAGSVDMFDQDNSYADTALRVGVTGDLLKGVSFGATAYAVSTLGLENNLVANTWTAAHSDDPAVGDAAWMGELWMAATMGKTTAKIGRMELDTPLAFSEKWSIVPNTFDAAVVINQDLPDTTLVGAWVGKSNGNDAGYTSTLSVNADRDGIMRDGAEFGTFALEGAYAAGLVNNSFKPATVQAWYYNVIDVADAYWLQADIDCQLVKGVKIGAQYANMDPKGTGITVAGTNHDSDAYAFKLGYTADSLNVSAAYSKTDKNGGLTIGNVAASGQSKLYTESWWTYGVVGAPDMKSWNVTAEYDVKNIAKLGVYYTAAEEGSTNYEMDEVAVTASKSFGPLDVTLAYINTDETGSDDLDTVQAYLTLNF